MRIYVRIVENRVIEIIAPAFDGGGEYIPIENRFTSEFVELLTDVTECDPTPIEGWSAVKSGDTWSFAPYVEPPPSDEQILASQSFKLRTLTQLANAQKSALTNRISTIQDAIDLEIASPEELVELPSRQGQLVEWKRYAVLLGRVTSQDGWPPEVDWPVQPSDGMDLTVSAAAPEVV